MAHDILEELFYGRLSPWEEIPNDDPAIAELIHEQSEIRTTLEKSVADADRNQLSKYLESRAEMWQAPHSH